MARMDHEYEMLINGFSVTIRQDESGRRFATTREKGALLTATINEDGTISGPSVLETVGEGEEVKPHHRPSQEAIEALTEAARRL